jgi:[ribosomal protein S5]-alanine N-acetyltransferase
MNASALRGHFYFYVMIFETKRLHVRRYTINDSDYFFALNGDNDVMRYIRPAKTRVECDQFLQETINSYEKDKRYGRWAVQDKFTKEFIGSFAIIPVEGKDQMQLGYALLPSQWGKGYATELTIAGIKYVFSKTPIDPLYAYTEGPNLPSQKVLLKAGFKPNGINKDGEKEVVGFVFWKEQYLANSIAASESR